MRSVMRLFRRLRDEESGLSLPEVMVSVLINGAAMVTIAAAIITFTAVQQRYANSANAAAQTVFSEIQWRTDVQTAAKIDSTDNTAVVFSSVLATGLCQTHTWSGVTSGGKIELQFVTEQFNTAPSADGSCSGSSTTATKTVIDDAGPNISFSYTNRVGRVITYTGGAATLDQSAAQPANVSTSDWSSTQIGQVTATASVGSTTENSKPFRFVQVASSLIGTASAIADGPTTLVTP